jgi:capsular exopolysaccharide synthesis family protein
MEEFESDIFNEGRNTLTIKDRVSKYLGSWPVFLISLAICIGIGTYYYLYTPPKFLATASLMVIDSKENNSKSSDIIDDALNGKQEVNLNDEILLLGSPSLMERTVSKNGFNIFYFHKGRILNIDIYKDAPFKLEALKITDNNYRLIIRIKNIDSIGGVFIYGPPNAEKSYRFSWATPFKIDGQAFVLQSKKDKFTKNSEMYVVKWLPVRDVSTELSKVLSVKAFDSKSNLIQLSLITGNLQEGVDILKGLLDEYNLSDFEDRDNRAKSTVQFIDNRLLNISGELKGVEGNLEEYQGSKEIVDIKGQSTQSLENSNNITKSIKDINNQQAAINMTSNYFSNPENNGKLIPSSLGLNDGTLSLLITQYNELQLKKQREAPSVAANSTVMQDLNTQLSSLKSSIMESLANIRNSLKTQENNFQQQNNQYKTFLSSIPHNERVLQEIKRKQGITEGLYLYLLQKREEAAISSTASNVIHNKQIEPPNGRGPIEPNLVNTLLYSILLGLALGFGWVYLRELLQDKIYGLYDIKKRTSLSIIGEISRIPRRKKQLIAVLGRTLAGEEFRVLRANISFLPKFKGQKTILVTSSSSNEGKSFASLNLAAVCAMPGKKVALLEFDLRNPTIAKQMSLKSTYGLTDFLTGRINSLNEIQSEIEGIPTLHIYPCGSLPNNAADLLLTKRSTHLFDALRREYDIIIIDSPPAGLVSDAFILGKHTDIVLFVIRQKKTLKKYIHSLNEMVTKNTLSNVFLILNDTSTSSEKYSNEYYYR